MPNAVTNAYDWTKNNVDPVVGLTIGPLLFLLFNYKWFTNQPLKPLHLQQPQRRPQPEQILRPQYTTPSLESLQSLYPSICLDGWTLVRDKDALYCRQATPVLGHSTPSSKPLGVSGVKKHDNHWSTIAIVLMLLSLCLGGCFYSCKVLSRGCKSFTDEKGDDPSPNTSGAKRLVSQFLWLHSCF
jgi:hypothetical protein